MGTAGQEIVAELAVDDVILVIDVDAVVKVVADSIDGAAPAIRNNCSTLPPSAPMLTGLACRKLRAR